jgi:hypothetical protein
VDFTPAEQAIIAAALKTWNDFFTASKGISLFLDSKTNQL